MSIKLLRTFTKPLKQNIKYGENLCSYCNETFEYNFFKVKQRNVSKCLKCHKFDHFSRMCRTKMKPDKHSRTRRGSRKVNQIDTDSESDSESELFLGMITLDLNSVNVHDRWSKELYINDQPVPFQLDTGARCNVLTRDTFKKIEIEYCFVATRLDAKGIFRS